MVLISAIIIPIVFIVMIILFLWGKVDQMLVSLIGAIIATFSLVILDGIEFELIVGFIFGTPANGFINFHTIVLSLGMLIIINICQETGVFNYFAFLLIQRTGGKRFQLFFILSILSFLFSAILNNILAILFFVPLTITVCKILKINPIPYIISMAILVNLGSLLFVISSIPNILIGQITGWTFARFFIEVGLFSFILILISSIFLVGYYKKNLEIPDKNLIIVLKQYDAWVFVKNKRDFYISLLTLIITLSLFIILPIFTLITIDMIAMSSSVILILIIANKNIRYIMKKLDFELLFYLIGVFLITDALNYTGTLEIISNWLIVISQGNLIISSIIVLWLSAGLSSLMNNAPVSKIMIPIINNLANTYTINPDIIYSSLVYGSNLGDNLTPWGDNLVAMKISGNYDIKLDFYKFFKIGIIISIIQLSATSVYIFICINGHFLFFGILILLILFIIIIFRYFYREIYNFFNKYLKKLLNNINL